MKAAVLSIGAFTLGLIAGAASFPRKHNETAPSPKPHEVRTESGLEYRNRIMDIGRAAGRRHIKRNERPLDSYYVALMADAVYPTDLYSDNLWRAGFLEGQSLEVKESKK